MENFDFIPEVKSGTRMASTNTFSLKPTRPKSEGGDIVVAKSVVSIANLGTKKTMVLCLFCSFANQFLLLKSED
tara:strand:- start:1342 stop:1563 length:222 start_codon:yes stop_codon:yes gene_type:complete